MYQLKIVCLLNFIFFCTCTTNTSIDDLLKNYDARFRPNFGKQPVNVKVSMFITKMFDYSEQDDMVKVNYYFRQSWTDPRLAFENTTIPTYIKEVNLGSNLVKKIWIPDTFSSNSHKLSFVSKDEENTFLLIYRNGTVFISKRLTAKIQCLGSKFWFPFDKKDCHIIVESYSMKTRDILYHWTDDNDVIVANDKLIPFYVSPGKTFSEYVNLLTGTYSIIGLKIHLERSYFNYLISLYMPIIFTTLLSGHISNSARRDCSSLALIIVSSLIFVTQFACSIFIKLSFNDKLTGTLSVLDIFLFINFLFILFYQFMHTTGTQTRSSIHKSSNTNTSLDTKLILNESTYSINCHHQNVHGLLKLVQFSLTLGYSIFIVSYLFVCITMRYLMSF